MCVKVDKEALRSIIVLKSRWMSTSSKFPVSTTVIRLSALDEIFVRQSAKQFWVGMWARSWILPEQASFRNIEIMWIVSFCSGRWIVLAVVTRFFASILMWILQLHRIDPSRTHGESGMNQNTSWKSTVLPLSYDRSRDSAKNTVLPHSEEPSSSFLWEASRNPSILDGPVSGHYRRFTCCDLICLANLLRDVTSPIVG